MGPFRDRSEAGRVLAARLLEYRRAARGLVLALPCGGVPVAWEISRILELPLDVFLVRKLGVPGHEELALGAVASGGMRVLNPDVMRAEIIADEVLERITTAARRDLDRQERALRGGRPFPDLKDRTVLLVDDGLATGATMRAAVQAVRALRPRSVVVAVPVGAREIVRRLELEADHVVCAVAPRHFYAVGGWYRNFAQVGEVEVRWLLSGAGPARPEQPSAVPSPRKVGGDSRHDATSGA